MFYPTPCRCGGLKDKRVELCLKCRKVETAKKAPARFWAKVEKTKGCWKWLGGKHLFGYGKIKLTMPRRLMDAHRYSWILHFGEIPAGLQVLHKCDNPECTRPDHLFLGTNTDNMRDKFLKNRNAKGASHGSRTHPEKFPGKPENLLAYNRRRELRQEAQ